MAAYQALILAADPAAYSLAEPCSSLGPCLTFCTARTTVCLFLTLVFADWGKGLFPVVQKEPGLTADGFVLFTLRAVLERLFGLML